MWSSLRYILSRLRWPLSDRVLPVVHVERGKRTVWHVWPVLYARTVNRNCCCNLCDMHRLQNQNVDRCLFLTDSLQYAAPVSLPPQLFPFRFQENEFLIRSGAARAITYRKTTRLLQPVAVTQLPIFADVVPNLSCFTALILGYETRCWNNSRLPKIKSMLLRFFVYLILTFILYLMPSLRNCVLT